MSLDFLQPFLDSRITFTRGTNATLTDSTGRITYAPNNLLTFSEQFDNAAWGKTNVTATANALVAPDGTVTADTLIEDTTNGVHGVSSPNATVALGPVTWSIFAKAGTRSWMWVNAFAGTNNRTWFNLANGTVGTTGAGATASIVSAGNGWYRCSVTLVSGTATVSMGINAANADNSTGYAGTTSAAAISLWGAQIEQVTYQTTPGTYVATTSAAYYGPRFDYDPVTLAPRGLLIEEQRSNLFTYSAEFDNAAWSKNNTTVTANATAAPDGTTSADKLVETATTAVHNAGQSITTTAVAYNFSCYVKAAERNFALLYHTQSNASVAINLSTGATGTASGTVAPTSFSVAAVGNGWWRVTMTVTATAASNFFGVYVMNDLVNASYAGTAGSGIYVWGAQLEVGAFATSYIPTVASTVTRNADVATMTGTNFSSWYNQSAGTFVVSGSTFNPASTSGRLVWVDRSSGTTYQYAIAMIARPGNGFWQSEVRDNDVTQAQLNATSSSLSGSFALAYNTNDFAASLNGAAAITDTSGTVPTGMDVMRIGNHRDNTYLNGHIRSIRYYPVRAADFQLQALTT